MVVGVTETIVCADTGTGINVSINANKSDNVANRGNPGFIVLPILCDAIGFTILERDSSAADRYSASLTERPSSKRVDV